MAKLFTPGMYVEAEIQTSQKESYALPSEALIELEGKYYALVKVPTGKKYTFKRIELKVGETTDNYTQILSDPELLKSNEFVVEGAFNLIQ